MNIATARENTKFAVANRHPIILLTANQAEADVLCDALLLHPGQVVVATDTRQLRGLSGVLFIETRAAQLRADYDQLRAHIHTRKVIRHIKLEDIA